MVAQACPMKCEEEIELRTSKDVDHLEALINFHFWMAKQRGETIVVEIWVKSGVAQPFAQREEVILRS